MSFLKKDGSSIISGDERTVERNSFRFWHGGGGDDGGDELVLLSWGDDSAGVFVVGDESVLLSWGDESVGEFVFGDELVLLSWGDESVGVFVVGDKLALLSWGDESVLTPKFLHIVAKLLGIISKRARWPFARFPLGCRRVVTFGGLRRTNPDADYKVLVRNAAVHKFGEFVVDYEVIELFPINDVVDAFFPCQTTLEQDVPQLIHRDSEEIGKAMIKRCLAWFKIGNFGRATSSIWSDLYLVPPCLLLVMLTKKRC
jgi:hypothetical protein